MQTRPYPYKRIFEPAEALADVAVRVAERQKAEPNMPYAKIEVYQNMYTTAAARLKEPDMLTLEQAAQKLSVTPDDYIAMAEEGSVILITLENIQAVPCWAFDADGNPDVLKNDIGREYAASYANDYFKFMAYLKFMTEARIDITETIAGKKLSSAFKKAGIDQYDCRISVNASPLQLVDQRQDKPAFWSILVHQLNSALTFGGFGDTYGGLSRPFRDKYNVPGLTYEEEMQRYFESQPKP